MSVENQKISRRAILVDQNPVHPLYLFTLTAEELWSIADISRISRDTAGKLIGYQRDEVRRHVQEITEYLDKDDEKTIIFPNSIILSLSSIIRFIQSRGPNVSDGLAVGGLLEIPIPPEGQKKPAWIVDGQQRALALLQASRTNFPIPISAFVADEVQIQRDQFIRINKTRPLPKGLIDELLPSIGPDLPATLASRRIPSAVCDWLNRTQESPFYGLIKRASSSEEEKKTAVVTDTALVKSIKDSIENHNGCLFPYRNLITGETDFDIICHLLMSYWLAVKETFPGDWGVSTTRSRLMHSLGIQSMGKLMDKIVPGLDIRQKNLKAELKREIQKVAPVCRWSEGVWEELGGIPWNAMENTPRYVKILSNYLIREYLKQAYH